MIRCCLTINLSFTFYKVTIYTTEERYLKCSRSSTRYLQTVCIRLHARIICTQIRKLLCSDLSYYTAYAFHTHIRTQVTHEAFTCPRYTLTNQTVDKNIT